jgi:hypothetical protein
MVGVKRVKTKGEIEKERDLQESERTFKVRIIERLSQIQHSLNPDCPPAYQDHETDS